MSPRRKRYRRMGSPPVLKGFRPFGVPSMRTEIITLRFEEYEALQLADYKKLSQEDASKIMNVSRPTFTRIYDSCLKKIAQAFAEGKAIVIDGGDVHFESNWFRCNNCNHVFSAEKVTGQTCPECSAGDPEHINETIQNWREEKYKYQIPPERQEPENQCTCPACGYNEPHLRGIPCYTKKCPECDSPLVRK